MLRIDCPFCGPREENEFVYGDDADRVRPRDPGSCTDAEWTDYLYFRTNTKGRCREWWWHVNGCTKWFVLQRDTVTHAITKDYNNDDGDDEI